MTSTARGGWPAANASVSAALGAAVLFGASTPLAKVLLGATSPVLLAGLLYAGSGLGLTLVLLVRDRRGAGSAQLTPAEWLWLLAATITGGILGPLLLMYGLVRTSAAEASLLLNLEVVLTALLAWVVFRENAGRRVVLGLALIVAGGMLLAWPAARAGGTSLIGVVAIVAACACWALDNNLTRKVSAVDPVFIAAIKGLAAGITNMALARGLGAQLPPAPLLAAALAVGFVGYGLSLALYVLALRGLGAARAAAYFSIAPFVGAALALAMFGQPLSPLFWAAALAMSTGVWLHLTEVHEHEHAHPAVTHTHAHRHDAHHQHQHELPWSGRASHTHPHTHEPLVHCHAHYPDVHHQHEHGAHEHHRHEHPRHEHSVNAQGEAYTCPMHPQVRRSSPGSCPICGMALEPLTPAEADSGDAELHDMSRRLWIGALLTLPLVVWEMGAHLGLAHRGAHLSPVIVQALEFALSTPVVLWSGWPFFERAAASVRNRSPNMFTLIALGVGAAYAYSVIATLVPGAFPASLRLPGGAIPVYYEAAAAITVLVLLGQVLELRARGRTGAAIRGLLKLAPPAAYRITAEGTDERIPLEQVQVQDRLRVRPGDSVPVDARVLAGASTVDESMITGESMPVQKGPGDELIAGTVNGTGSLIVRATRVGAETLLAQIVRTVADAQRSRAPIQRVADAVSAWFVPAILCVALLTFAAWMLWGPAPRISYALTAAVSVLIIACPCALGLATPMSIVMGIGKGAGAGVLVRDAGTLERLEKVDTVVVDKTGTLTEGAPAVIAAVAAGPFAENVVLGLAASVERASEHPLAAAILRAAAQRGLDLQEPADFSSITGQGVRARVGEEVVVVGNATLVGGRGPSWEALETRAQEFTARGATVVYVTVDAQPAGILAIADPVRASTPAALERLRGEGLRIFMLTGDNRRTAQAVASQLGIAAVEAEVLPADKSRVVQRLRSEGHVVAMAGDGTNDAPALAAADVGLAMGSGTDIAMETAGITLLKGDLGGIVRARALSAATMRNIRQNLVLAFAYNVLAVPLAAGVLYPSLGVMLSPVVAAAAMSLSSVSVIANALRLRLLHL